MSDAVLRYWEKKCHKMLKYDNIIKLIISRTSLVLEVNSVFIIIIVQYIITAL
jgi:hypothetical protein